MRKQLLSTIVACGACLAWAAQAQTATDPASSSSSTYPSTSPSSSSGWSSGHMRPTGRMSHEAVRGSQLTGAQVKSSSGTEIGTISDTIISPASGRVECAVISLSGAGNSGVATSSSGTAAGTAGTGKQVAVPWMLLRPSSAGASSATGTATASTPQPSFVFTGDASKLESAPTFDPNTDLSQPNWRQSVFSYFGFSGRGNNATGAAETPGGSSTGSQTPQSSTGKP